MGGRDGDWGGWGGLGVVVVVGGELGWGDTHWLTISSLQKALRASLFLLAPFRGFRKTLVEEAGPKRNLAGASLDK